MGNWIIISQFIMVTAGVALLMMFWYPVLSAVAFDSGLYEQQSAQGKALMDAWWSWSIIIPIVGQVGNIMWFFTALRRQSGQSIEF